MKICHLHAAENKHEAVGHGKLPFPVEENASGHLTGPPDANSVADHVDKQERHHVQSCP